MGGFKNKKVTLSFGVILYSIVGIILGFSKNYYVFVTIIFLLSFSIPFIQTPVMTILQEKVSEDFQGRAFSILNILYSGFMPLGMILFGLVADIVAIEYLIIISSAVLLLFGITSLLIKSE